MKKFGSRIARLTLMLSIVYFGQLRPSEAACAPESFEWRAVGCCTTIGQTQFRLYICGNNWTWNPTSITRCGLPAC
jgi:hypothetical protein